MFHRFERLSPSELNFMLQLQLFPLVHFYCIFLLRHENENIAFLFTQWWWLPVAGMLGVRKKLANSDLLCNKVKLSVVPGIWGQHCVIARFQFHSIHPTAHKEHYIVTVNYVEPRERKKRLRNHTQAVELIIVKRKTDKNIENISSPYIRHSPALKTLFGWCLSFIRSFFFDSRWQQKTQLRWD